MAASKQVGNPVGRASTIVEPRNFSLQSKMDNASGKILKQALSREGPYDGHVGQPPDVDKATLVMSADRVRTEWSRGSASPEAWVGAHKKTRG